MRKSPPGLFSFPDPHGREDWPAGNFRIAGVILIGRNRNRTANVAHAVSFCRNNSSVGRNSPRQTLSPRVTLEKRTISWTRQNQVIFTRYPGLPTTTNYYQTYPERCNCGQNRRLRSGIEVWKRIASPHLTPIRRVRETNRRGFLTKPDLDVPEFGRFAVL